MCRPFFVFFLACVFVLLSLQARAEEVSVVHIFDGDTVKLADGRILRLAGIDAPEIAHKETPAQIGASQARLELVRITEGKRFELKLAPQKEDRYGRILGTLRFFDGSSVQHHLIVSGLAFVYPHPDLEHQTFSILLEYQRKAIEEGRGVWPKVLPLMDQTGPFVGNRSSMRFGPAACPTTRKIKLRNREVFLSAREAFQAGMAPYRKCSPWPSTHK